MNANQWQSHFAAGALPGVVVHGVDGLASKREDPDRVKQTLRFNDRPRDIIQDHNVRSFGFEGFGRNHEHAAP